MPTHWHPDGQKKTLRIYVPKWTYFGLKVVPVWVHWGQSIYYLGTSTPRESAHNGGPRGRSGVGEQRDDNAHMEYAGKELS